MKKESGITLISLIIYVIVMTFVVAAVSGITASFYSNLNDFDKGSESAVSYSKFNMYFIKDIKRKGIQISEAHEDYIILTYEKEAADNEIGGGISVSGGETMQIEYVLQNNILYRNKVKICENVNELLITADNVNNIVKIQMTIGDYKKETTYKLESIDTLSSEGPVI